jgi:hypothetical protein
MSKPDDKKNQAATPKDQTKPPEPVKTGYGVGDPPPVKVGYGGEVGKKK